jgi:hypothetical protein
LAQEKTRVKYDGYTINFSSGNGYPTIFVNGKNVLLHRYIWEKERGEIPDGYEIHHKDKNRSNYSVDNLELINIKDHHRKHAIENGLGKSNKGKLKRHDSGFCKGATPVVLIKGDCELKFESVTAAARFLNIGNIGDVSRVLTGKRKTIHGYKCEYLKEGV